MTKRFEISNQTSGVVLGIFEGETEQAALDAMARDAGYRDYAHLDREVPAQPGEIIVTALPETCHTPHADTEIDDCPICAPQP